ncbi:MAG: hypothetical protein HPY64_16120 [Anaerolineae bacterium]|nr:hypothetical protein [Anaerolineae bacterium]
MACIGGQTIGQTNAWRETQHRGAQLQAEMARRQAALRPERIVPSNARQDHQRLKGVSLDGGMVHVRGEGWKEFKVGVVYDLGVRDGYDVRSGEAAAQPCAEQSHYTAVLGDVARFSPALWELAAAHDLLNAARSSVTADGAEWIWNLCADIFPDSVQIVDWYHATQHLAEAAQALFPTAEAQAISWYHQAQDLLFYGQAWRIVQTLHQAGLPDLALYFERHQRRMRYHEFREEGWLIGSGPVESGIKQYRTRLAGAECTGPAQVWSGCLSCVLQS